jgi:hypothetical protein
MPLVVIERKELQHLHFGEGEAARINLVTADRALPPSRGVAVIRQMGDGETALLHKLPGTRFGDTCGGQHLVPQHDEWHVVCAECDLPPSLGHRPDTIFIDGRTAQTGILRAMRITRDELHNQIWSQPATKLAQRYDVSSSYLARVCEALNVPRPPRGYWARRAAGEKMPVPPLPPAAPGDPLSWEKGVAVMERLTPLELPTTSNGSLALSKRPVHHPLVTAWRGFLERAVLTEAGYLVPRKRNVLDAFVTEAMIRGAAEAMDAILIELEVRGHRVQLSADYHHRPPVDVGQRPIKSDDDYYRRPDDWRPHRPTVTYLRDVQIGLTLFELTEHVRVRRTGADRYVRISDLPPTRRYAPQSPEEADETRDMPTGRFVLRAFAPRQDAPWQHEWTERHKGEFVAEASAIADALEEAEPVIVKLVEDADRREQERRVQAAREERRRRARERAEARQLARQAAKDELHAILKAWTDAFAREAFFDELSRRAQALEREARASLEARIQRARALADGQDAVERFLKWLPPVEDDAGTDDSGGRVED